MAKFKYPGVYVEESSNFSFQITEKASTVPAFIGYTAITNDNGKNLLFQAFKIQSIIEFDSLFESDENPPQDHSGFYLRNSVQLFFKNGGTICYIVPIGNYGQNPSQIDFNKGLDCLDDSKKITVYLFPDAVLLNEFELGEVQRYALSKCREFPHRFCILDMKNIADNQDIYQPIKIFRNHLGTENLKFGAAYTPWLKIPSTDGLLEIPASGAIAGVYAKTAFQKGLWKAPANVSLNGVVDLAYDYSTIDQEFLTLGLVQGKSINAIRKFPGREILVWGARTLAGNDGEWRYVNMVRFQNHLIASIKNSLEKVVFEPNDANLWMTLKAVIETYLYGYWRNGAFPGRKTEEAYFIKCGLGSTMTSQDLAEGKLIIWIGMATIQPAEFSLFKLEFQMVSD